LTGFLLDTHTLVWAIDTPDVLSEPARQAIADGPVYLSVVSLWELIVKRSKDTALLADPVDWWNRYVSADAMNVLPVTADHIVYLERLRKFIPTHLTEFCYASIQMRQSYARELARSGAVLPQEVGGAAGEVQDPAWEDA